MNFLIVPINLEIYWINLKKTTINACLNNCWLYGFVKTEEELEVSGMDKVSIIVPVYNTEKYLERSLTSIIEQTYKNLEIILINDATQDHSLDIIKKYQSIDKRILLISNEKNLGAYHARIRGIQQATGSYIAFVDSDDCISIDFIRLLISKAKETNADIVVGDTVHCTENNGKFILPFHEEEINLLPLFGQEIKEHFFRQTGLCYSWHVIWNKLYKKEIFDRALPYMLKMKDHLIMTEDIIFSVILITMAKSMDRAKRAEYYYWQNVSSITNEDEISFVEFQKKFSDVRKVFDFCRQYLEEIHTSTIYLQMFHEFRKLYARGWEKISSKLLEGQDKAKEMIDLFYVDHEDDPNCKDSYFDRLQYPYDERLENLKKRVFEGTNKYVCFASGINEKCILLDEQDEKFSILKKEIEIHFFLQRKAVKELYALAILSGKKVFFNFGGELKQETCKRLLMENGFLQYEEVYCSKVKGSLSEEKNYHSIINRFEVTGDQILYVGDSFVPDIIMAKKTGMQIQYFPQTMDRFLWTGCNVKLDEMSFSFKNLVGGITSKERMVAVAANTYFDNPFRYVHPICSGNSNLEFEGYVVLGINLLLICQWIEQVLQTKKEEQILFSNKEGKLVQQAFEIYSKKKKLDVEIGFLDTLEESDVPIALYNAEGNKENGKTDLIIQLEEFKKYLASYTLNKKQKKENKEKAVENLMPYIEWFPTEVLQKKAKEFIMDYFEMIYLYEEEINRISQNQRTNNNTRKECSKMEYVKHFLLGRNKNNRKLALWGAGSICKNILDIYGQEGVDAFIDNDIAKYGTKIGNKTILSPHFIMDSKEFYIIIVCAAYEEIETQLKHMNMREYEDFIVYYKIF